MSELMVSIHDQSGRVDGALTAGEVFDDQRMLVKQFPLTVGETTSLEIVPGHYLVRATLPSSVTVSGEVEVTEQTANVSLTTQDSPHEWLAWQVFSTGLAPPIQSPEEISGLGPNLGEGVGAGQRARWRREEVVWRRMWRRTGSTWTLLPWPESWADTDGESWKYSFKGFGSFLTAVQVGGLGAAWRQTLLPPAERVEVLIRPSGNNEIFERGVQFAVESNDQPSEAVLRYLESGSWQATRVVGEQLVLQAEKMLRGKLENPFRAAVGGYYLLRAKAFGNLHDWPNNFANWFSWLPDAAVIHAWQLLESGNQDALILARQRLLQAVHAGLPTMTEGLRLLAEGLRRVERLATAAGQQDEEIKVAMGRIAQYTDATDWTQPFTTFYGLEPASPAIDSAVGVPLGWDELEFLAENEGGAFAEQPVGIQATFRVSASGTKWEVGAKDVPDFKAQRFSTKARALKQAQKIAQEYVPSRLILYRRNGSVEEVQQYPD